MSATQNSVDWQAGSDQAASIEHGRRVLASIGDQEGLRALLAFSDLHENIRNRPPAAGSPADEDLIRTERFVLHEILQLVCARAVALTQAETVIVALAEGTEFVCRAVAGAIAIPLGTRLNNDSKLLAACLITGKILRCDETQNTDTVASDLARQFAARSTVLVPLRGRNERLGVMQAFSAHPWAFTDQDIRCFDLFAELVLSALKPTDQDRRLHWLSDVADEVLQRKSIAAEISNESANAEAEKTESRPEIETQRAEALVETTTGGGVEAKAETEAKIEVEPAPLQEPELAPATPAAPANNLSAMVQFSAPIQTTELSTAASDLGAAAELCTPANVHATADISSLDALTRPIAIPTEMFELPEFEPEDLELPTYLTFEKEKTAIDSAERSTEPLSATPEEPEHRVTEQAAPPRHRDRRFSDETSDRPSDQAPYQVRNQFRDRAIERGALANAVFSGSQPARSSFASRPGLSVVLALIVVAGLFSAGVWWGMQFHTHDFRPNDLRSADLRSNDLRSGDLRPNDSRQSSNGGHKSAESAAVAAATKSAARDVLDLSVGNPTAAAAQSQGASQGISNDASAAPVSEAKLAALPKITSVRHWSSSVGSTVVIDLEDQVNYEVHRLMSPERIYFDLPETALPADLDGKSMDIGDPSLTRVRVAQPVPGITRVVLDTKDGSNFSVSMETNPYRLVVELRDTEKSLTAKRSAPAVSAPAAPAPSPFATMATAKPTQPIPAHTGKFRIVLDAGHGGWDLGTVGRQGLLEKDLVLDVTRRLGKLLQSRAGADVLFTRSGDDYLALDQRADIANQAQADLFVSVHANYSSSATARGVETYYTNSFAAPGTKEMEKHPGGTFDQPTPVTLSAAGLHEKIEESRRLAASVQHALYGALAEKNPDIRDRGIKDASFVVLTGTTMPSILTEISFVSSPADERSLQSETYRQQIAEALFKGIAHYEEASPKTKVAQLRTNTASR